MKQYTIPRTDVVSVQITTSILTGSPNNNLPIGGGEAQEISW